MIWGKGIWKQKRYYNSLWVRGAGKPWGFAEKGTATQDMESESESVREEENKQRKHSSWKGLSGARM